MFPTALVVDLSCRSATQVAAVKGSSPKGWLSWGGHVERLHHADEQLSEVWDSVGRGPIETKGLLLVVLAFGAYAGASTIERPEPVSGRRWGAGKALPLSCDGCGLSLGPRAQHCVLVAGEILVCAQCLGSGEVHIRIVGGCKTPDCTLRDHRPRITSRAGAWAALRHPHTRRARE